VRIWGALFHLKQPSYVDFPNGTIENRLLDGGGVHQLLINFVPICTDSTPAGPFSIYKQGWERKYDKVYCILRERFIQFRENPLVEVHNN
jgi:hypothetical protein